MKSFFVNSFLFIAAFCLIFSAKTLAAGNPPVVHPKLGSELKLPQMTVKLIDRRQNYNAAVAETRDVDVASPKSVNIHPNGKKCYVNSLEGFKTVVFELPSMRKITTISHKFTDEHKNLWTANSGFFKFNHTYKNPDNFSGKPVEGAFSHNGKYFWVPYYRRDYDTPAQEPSAIALIDTETDKIVRIFETGVLPKMILASPDKKYVAVAHWGDNTVGIIDTRAASVSDWKYVACPAVDHKLNLVFAKNSVVNRDVNSGYCLRGMAYSPDNQYLFVACMGGGGGIAVIDMTTQKYLGRLLGVMSNVRHLVMSGEHLFASINKSGHVQKISLSSLYTAINELKTGKKTASTKWESCKIEAGARTIVVSPNGKYIFAACNFSNCLAVVDAQNMRYLGKISADSYPVGLDISSDGKYVILTSQARPGVGGGNCVDLFQITYHQ